MEKIKSEKKYMIWIVMLFRFFKGVIIGIGAILPGISGGVLCVVFGIDRKSVV